MKSFEERKTLIYERSKDFKKINKLKRNSAISCICLGLVCITIACVTRFSGNDYTNNAPTGKLENTDGSLSQDRLTADTDGTQDNFGYCGNTVTTVASLFNEGEEYSFSGGDSITLTDLLLRLDYKREDICRCVGHYLIETEGGKYYVNLSEAYARNGEGQATLNDEQVEKINAIIERAKQSKGE